jgi:transposase
MRFVAVKSERQQAAALVFRTRDLLVRQRTLAHQRDPGSPH